MLVNKAFTDLLTFSRGSGAGYFNSAGIFVQAANDAPRFDYDPVTLQPRGLLLEEARTNQLTNSATFGQDGSGWNVGSNSTVSTGTGAPDGGATTIVNNTSVANAFVARSYTPIQNQAFTASIWWRGTSKPSAGTVISLEYRDASNVSQRATLPFSGASVIADGKWRRYSVTATHLGSNVSSVFAYFFTDTGVASIEGFGPQLEQGSFMTSYIRTTGAQATRVKDSAWINDASFAALHNQSEFSLVLSHAPIAVKKDSIEDWGGAQIRADGSNIFALRIYSGNNVNQADAVGANAGVAQFDTWGVQPAAGEVVTQGFALRANDLAYTFNGGPVETDSSVTLFTANRLEFGTNQWVRSLRYYPRRLSNAELQALTVL